MTRLRFCRVSPWIMAVRLGCSSSGRIRKRAKARSQIRDWEYDWHSWTVKMRITPENTGKDNRLILLYKVKGKASKYTNR